MPKLQNLLSGTLVLNCFSDPVSLQPGQMLTISEELKLNAEIQRLLVKKAVKVVADDVAEKPKKEPKADKKESLFETTKVKSEKNNDVVVVQKKTVVEKAVKTEKVVAPKTPKVAKPKKSTATKGK